MADLIGLDLGQYRITAKLGSGGMATVYRAEQISVRRDVAVKVIEGHLADSEEFAKRFEREAYTIASLNHPHILKLFDYGHLNDMLYLVMELQPGGSLADRVRKGPLDVNRAGRILDDLASALDYAHNKGVVHRDMKPQNVLFDESGEVHLTDFGIAKLINETTVLTQSNVTMGTPAYMSPEQCQGKPLDGRTDIYSLGVILYEMLTGTVPFKAETPIGMVYMHINEPPPSLSQFRSDLPPAVEKVLLKALAKDPANRFAWAGEFANAYRIALSGQMPPGLDIPSAQQSYNSGSIGVVGGRSVPAMTPTAPPRRNQSSWFVFLGAIAFILVLGLLIMKMVSDRGNQALSPGQDTPSTVVAIAPTDVPTQTPQQSEAPPTASALAPSATSSETPSLTPTVSPTHTPSVTATETLTPTLTSTATLTETPSATFTETPTVDVMATVMVNVQETMTQSASQTAFTVRIADTARAEILSRLTEIATLLTLTPSNTPTSTPVATLTNTSTATNTLVVIIPATRTNTPTEVVFEIPANTDTPVFTATSESVVVEITAASANMRSGPGAVYSRMDTVYEGEHFNVIAKFGTVLPNIWYLVERPGKTPAWVWSGAVKLIPETADVAAAQTIPAPPRPTPTPIPPTPVPPTPKPPSGYGQLIPSSPQDLFVKHELDDQQVSQVVTQNISFLMAAAFIGIVVLFSRKKPNPPND